MRVVGLNGDAIVRLSLFQPAIDCEYDDSEEQKSEDFGWCELNCDDDQVEDPQQ